MSTHPTQDLTQRRKVTVPTLAQLKAQGEPIVTITAYDYPTAQVVEAAGVDVVLVGDSAGMTVLGYESTVPVTSEEMIMLSAAVKRGLTSALLVVDLPFGSYEASNEQAVRTAQRFVKETGCDAVKIERGGSSVERARAIVAAGVPVMGHVGLTPQTAAASGGYRARGRSAVEALEVYESALALQQAGCFSIVLEAIPSPVAAAITKSLDIPTIGIGAGPEVDGQVLVFHDLLGIYGGRTAKFVKQYAQIRTDMVTGVEHYTAEVRSRSYPQPEHEYAMPEAEVELFQQQLA